MAENKKTNKLPRGIRGRGASKKSDETRQRILDASIELFRENGFGGVSVEDITKKSGTSVGSFYHHFESKDELVLIFLQITREHDYEDYETTVMASEEFAKKNELERLKDFLFFSTNANRAIGEEFLRVAITCMLCAESDYLAYKYSLDTERHFAVITKRLIQEGQEAGYIRTDMSVEEVFWLVDVFVNGLEERWFLSRGRQPSVQKVSDSLDDFLYRMLISGNAK